MSPDRWTSGDAYEAYVGRWSRRVAADFVTELRVGTGRTWLDVGCGTGALTAAVLALADPAQVTGVDPSDGFLRSARTRIVDPRASFRVADAQSLPFPDEGFDVVVSALALNFVPDPARAAAEFARVARPGAMIAAYVWDYAEGMGMMRAFWDAATEVDPAAAERDEVRRFPLCRPEPLAALWIGAGIDEVSVWAVRVSTVFGDFDDYWRPFLGGQGPAPGYLASVSAEHREVLRERLRARLPVEPDGSIVLSARAWAVRGVA